MKFIKTEDDMKTLGRMLGETFQGGEVVELIGDVGAGKTTLVKGIGEGLKVDDDVQSPSFTLSRQYACRDDLSLHHYDFYRLNDAGVMSYEFSESTNDQSVVTVVEWAETVQSVLPDDHIIITIAYTPDGEGRQVDIKVPEKFSYIKEGK